MTFVRVFYHSNRDQLGKKSTMLHAESSRWNGGTTGTIPSDYHDPVFIAAAANTDI